MNGCEVQELDEKGLVSRLISGRNRDNAIREVNNVLATQPIYQIYHDGIEAILRGYKMTLEDAKEGLLDIYTTVLRHFGSNGELTAKDADQLDRLRILFGLPEDEIEELNKIELARFKSEST